MTDKLNDIEDLITALYIQMSRLYDVQMSLLALSYPEEAASLLEQHKDGVIVTPIPALKGTDEDNAEA